MPPRTHQTRRASVLGPPPTPPPLKTIINAFVGNAPSDVADQKTVWMPTKGWPGGRLGPEVTDGSIRLISSTTEGSRQPFRLLTVLLRQAIFAPAQDCGRVSGVRSQTRPVSLSNTASLSQFVRTKNRTEAGSFRSH